MQTKEQRRADILDLVRQHRIRSQAELRTQLQTRGVSVNQATLSRDLRDLGVRKGPQGYEVPAETTAESNGQGTGADLRHALHEWLRDAIVVQHQVVIKTPPGGASPLALALDRSGLPDLVGTLAGDDTALLICADARAADRLAARLRQERQEQESTP